MSLLPDSLNKWILLIIGWSFAAGILISYPLWVDHPEFPSTPLIPVNKLFPPPLDILPLLCFLLSILSLWKWEEKRWHRAILVISGGILLLADQNRWQPWVFEYSLLLFAWYALRKKSSSRKYAFQEAVVWALAGIYVWSGLQKFNENYFVDTSYWIMEPWDSMFGLSKTLGKIAWLIPPLEVILGIGLLFSKTRRSVAGILILMHVFIMVNMGILKGYNWVIQPWNACNILLLFLLAWRKEATELEFFPGTKRPVGIKIVILFTWILPALSLVNGWDSYLSARLYSGNSSNGYIIFSESVKNQLPSDIQALVQYKDGNPYIYINNWCMQKLRIPSYPEKRIYMSSFKRIRSLTNLPEECSLVITDQFNILKESDVEIVQ